MRWEQPDVRYSHWTTALFNQWYPLSLLFVTLFHIYLSSVLPPAEDELYYWTWGKEASLSYYDHPPMLAWIVALTTSLFGDSLLSLRLPAVILNSLVLLMLGSLCANKLVLGCLLLTPLFFIGGVLLTPDVPLLFFSTAYLIWFCKVTAAFSTWSEDPVARVYRNTPIGLLFWGSGGSLLGLGLLSKYTALLLVPCAFFTLMARFRFRAWLWGFLFHLFIAGIFFSPVLLFNLQTEFTSIFYQWNHGMSSSSISIGGVFEFMGVQSLLLGGLPFLLTPWILLRLAEFRHNPLIQTCLWFFIPTCGFFLFRSLFSPLEANWALISYLPFWPVAGLVVGRIHSLSKRLLFLTIAFAGPFLVTIFFLLHCHSPFSVISPAKDRLNRLWSQFKLSKHIAELSAQLPLFAPTYQWTAYFRFHGLDAYQLKGAGKESHFTVQPIDPCKHSSVVVFSEGEPTANSCFTSKEIIGQYPLEVRGVTLTQFQLTQFSR